MNYKNDDRLKRLQQNELKILLYIDKICRKYNIIYTLYGGSAIGAVRHSGFIPWDDDIDIAMTRENYDKFIEAWKIEQPDDYFFQDYYIDPEFRQCFGKVRENGTQYMSNNYEKKYKNQGIFVDIFPLDKIPKGNLEREIYYLCGMFYVLFSRGYSSKKNGRLLYRVTYIFSKIIPDKCRVQIRDRLCKFLKKYNNTDSDMCVDNSIVSLLKTYYPLKCFLEPEFMKFEEKIFPVHSNFDLCLRLQYGDYMKLPPEESRIPMHKGNVLKFKDE